MGKKLWKQGLVYAVYIFVILNLIVTTERIVFDVFGRMWITLLVNAFISLSSFVCLLGLFYRKKSAIIAYIVVALASVGTNVVIILMYNQVGVLKGTESYLSVPFKSHSWWSNHGFLCYRVCDGSQGGGGGGNGGDDTGGSGSRLSLIDGTLEGEIGGNILGSGQEQLATQACFITYTVIESSHAVLNASLTLMTILLSLCMICKEGKKPEEESFPYMSIGKYGGNATTLQSKPSTRQNTNANRPSYYQLSDSFDTIGSKDTVSSSSSM